MAIEIERKWVVKKPEIETLNFKDIWRIVQTYLPNQDGFTQRVRSQENLFGEISFFHNLKKFLDLGRNEEIEKKISKEEYHSFLEKSVKKKAIIKKNRIFFEHEGNIFELDIFLNIQVLKGFAILELELPSLDTEFELPRSLEIIKEVTEDKKFSNSSISRGELTLI